MNSRESSAVVWTILTGVTAIYVTACITMAALIYKSFGLWFKLEVGVELSLFAYLVIFISNLRIMQLKQN